MMKKHLDKIRSIIRRNRGRLIAIGLTLTFVLVFLWPSIVISVRPGELGVLYSRFFGGTVLDRTYGEGVHFIQPWDVMSIYDVRIQEETQNIDVLTVDGLTVKAQVSLRFQLIRDRLPKLHQSLGPNYRNKIIIPIMNSAVRQTIGSYRPDDLYSSARQELQDLMLVDAVEEMGRIPILIHGFVVKSIRLPEVLRGAIEEKLVAEQSYLRYDYLLKEAAQEARRKAIEGLGIKNYQALVNTNMTRKYLSYEGIKATRELASSNNAKVIVIGGKEGLPIILNTDSQPDTTEVDVTPEQVAPPWEGTAAAREPAAPEGTAAEKDAVDSSGLDDTWMRDGESFIDFMKRLDRTLLAPRLPGMSTPAGE